MRKYLTALLLFAMPLSLFPASSVLVDGAIGNTFIYTDSRGLREHLWINDITVLLTSVFCLDTDVLGDASNYPAYCLHPDKPSLNESQAYSMDIHTNHEPLPKPGY